MVQKTTTTIAQLPATITNSVVGVADLAGFSASMLKIATLCKIVVRSGSVNIYCNGSNPTVSTGIPVTVWADVTGKEDIAALRMIRNGTTNADVVILLEA